MQIDNRDDIETVLKALLVAIGLYEERYEKCVTTGNIRGVYWEKQRKMMQDTYDRLNEQMRMQK